MSTKAHKFPVIELFGPTLQGEGLLIGRPTHFLRFGGCSYACTWCDSMHAVDPAQIKINRRMMTSDDIFDVLGAMQYAPWLTLTGGDPAIQPLDDFIVEASLIKGFNINVETQGEFFPEWLQRVDLVTFSPKGPSSGNVTHAKSFREKLHELRRVANGQVCIKVVVFTPEDMSYALQMYDMLQGVPDLYELFVFQVGSPVNSQIPEGLEPEEQALWKVEQILTRYRMIAPEVLRLLKYPSRKVAVLPQQHVLLWPLEDRGR